MRIRLPFIWLTIAYIAGITIGDAMASPFYIYAALAILSVVTVCRKQQTTSFILTLVFWILLGCSSISIFPRKEAVHDTVKVESHPINTWMQERLTRAGVRDDAFRISSALLLGNKTALSRDAKQAFARVGASHLLALSGMHMGIIYGILYILFIRSIMFRKWKWLLLPFILSCIWGYALIVGMPVSLVRAAIMLSIFSVISFSQKDSPPIHALGVGALFILLIKPSELFSISFQLSFAAMLFIITAYPPIRKAIRRLQLKHLTGILEIIGVSFIAQLGTAPLSIYYFHSLPLLSILSSVLLIPLSTIIIYLCLATILLPISILGQTLTLATKLELTAVEWLGNIPYTYIIGIDISIWEVAAIYMILFCLIFYTASKERRR